MPSKSKNFNEPSQSSTAMTCPKCGDELEFIVKVIHREWKGGKEVEQTHNLYLCKGCEYEVKIPAQEA